MSNLLISTTTTTLLLLAFLFLSPPTTTADIRTTAVDSEGDLIRVDTYYYVMPIATQKGGGLTLFNKASAICPDFVVARSTKGDTDFGIPVTFILQNDRANNSNVNIAFKYLSPEPFCRRAYTTLWSVDPVSSRVVLSIASSGDAGFFQLELYGDELTGGYKILAGDEGKTVLYEEQENGEILLGVATGEPLLVTFVKA